MKYNEQTWHVIFSLNYKGSVCIMTISIPDVPCYHQITVGESILNLDRLLEKETALECEHTDGTTVSIPLNEDTPKSSQVVMIATNIVVMSEAEYREYCGEHEWDEELNEFDYIHQGSTAVN